MDCATHPESHKACPGHWLQALAEYARAPELWRLSLQLVLTRQTRKKSVSMSMKESPCTYKQSLVRMYPYLCLYVCTQICLSLETRICMYIYLYIYICVCVWHTRCHMCTCLVVVAPGCLGRTMLWSSCRVPNISSASSPPQGDPYSAPIFLVLRRE